MTTESEESERQMREVEQASQALQKEKDEASQQRLGRREKERSDLKEKSAQVKAQWQSEKQVIERSRKLQEQIEKLKLELDQAQRLGDLAKASEIQYGRLPELLKEFNAHNQRFAELQ